MLLEPIKAEREGKIDRSRLLAIQGRGRKPQLQLATDFGITNYAPPAGGCLLTDPIFSKRLRDLFSHEEDRQIRDLDLLKYGRHFRLNPQAKLIVGRTEKDNEGILHHHDPCRGGLDLPRLQERLDLRLTTQRPDAAWTAGIMEVVNQRIEQEFSDATATAVMATGTARAIPTLTLTPSATATQTPKPTSTASPPAPPMPPYTPPPPTTPPPPPPPAEPLSKLPAGLLLVAACIVGVVALMYLARRK